MGKVTEANQTTCKWYKEPPIPIPADWKPGDCGGALDANRKCTVCGRRPYYFAITVANGGLVHRCGGCKKLTGLRWVTEVRYCAGTDIDSHTYRLCDDCTDAELREYIAHGAAARDCRTPTPYSPQSGC